GAELDGGADEDALDFFGRDELALFCDGDVKAAVFEAQVGARGVEDELHGRQMASCKVQESKQLKMGCAAAHCDVSSFNPCFDG
ncbi:hypothetical protein DWB58_30185, partial [candidate division KSB1 bacterium]|nr:hypothetical protein [candidate division KSB1 bacterium]MCE7945449.1 hypothetical protein [Chlorobi bacterium CHB1]